MTLFSMLILLFCEIGTLLEFLDKGVATCLFDSFAGCTVTDCVLVVDVDKGFERLGVCFTSSVEDFKGSVVFEATGFDTPTTFGGVALFLLFAFGGSFLRASIFEK